jgi:nucleoid-associated protein YejK
MTLRKVIIHQIPKVAGNPPADALFSNTCNDHEHENSTELYEKLKEGLKVSNPIYGSFAVPSDQLGQRNFPSELGTYLASPQSHASFVDFTKRVVASLHTKLLNIPAYAGGYFLFTESESNQQNYVSVFLIRKSAQFDFAEIQDRFDIKKLNMPDVRHLAMGARICTTEYFEKLTANCIYLFTRQRDHSQYFWDWLDVLEHKDSIEYSNNFVQLINRMPAVVDRDSGQERSATETKALVANYLADRQGMLNTRSLSEYLFDDADVISGIIDEFDIKISSTFKFHPRVQRDLRQVTLAAEGVNVRFPRGFLDNNRVRKLDGNLGVIIESRELAEALTDEIERL